MTVRSEYNSNLFLADGPQKSVLGYWLSPATKFAGSTESFQMSGRLAMDYVQYYGSGDTSFVNVYFPLSAQYRDERSTWGFDGGLTRDNTLMSELAKTGLVLSFTQRNLWGANPIWTYNLTERVSFQSGYQYQNATYENGLRLGLVDYEVHSGTQTTSYQVTEADSIQLTGLFTRFVAPTGNDLVSDSYGAQLGGSHAFSERTAITVSGGPRFITNTINTGLESVRDSKTIWVMNGSLTTRGERARGTVEIGREIFPSGFGLLVQTDRVAATVGYDLTDKITLSLSGQAYLVSPVLSSPLSQSFQENRFVTATPQITWRVGEYWTIEASYTYSRRDIEVLDQIGIANIARLTVTYFPPKWSVGR